MVRSHTSKSVSISTGLTWTYFSSFVQAGLRVLVLSVMARLLDPHQFGLIGIALIFTSCAERVGQIGVELALIQKEHFSEEDARAGMLLSLLSGLLIAASLYLMAPFVSAFFGAPEVDGILKILALGFIVDGFAVVSDARLHRQLKFREVMMSENVSYVVGNVVIGILLAYLGYGVWSLVWSSLGMKIVRLAILLYMEPPVFSFRVKREAVRNLLGKGFGFSLGKILTFFALQGDNFVVGRVLGVEMLGMYTRAYQLMSLPATYLGQSLERVLFPAMSKDQGDPVRLKRIFFISVEAMTLVGLPMSIAMFLLSREIILVLFGSKWETLVPVLTILSLGVFCRTAYKSSDTLARSLGAVYQHALRQGIYTVMVVGGAYIGATQGGMQGVAVGVVTAVTVNYLIMTRLSARFLNLPLRGMIAPHLPGIWIALWVGAALAASLPVLRELNTYPLAVLMGAGVIAFATALTAASLAPRRARSQLVAQLLHRLRIQRFGGIGQVAVRFLS